MSPMIPSLVLLLTASSGMARDLRDRRFDDHWRFLKADAPGADKPDFDDSVWRALDVPHDWSIEDLPPMPASQPAGAGADGKGNDLPAIRVGPFAPRESPGAESTGHVLGGIGWYRKHFKISAADRGKVVSIRFDGVYMDADVWINGHHLGGHPYGYTPFSFELTRWLKPIGESNLLAVRVRNLGQNSRWYSGSGIYRHVWLIVTDTVRVADGGIAVTTPNVTPETATVNVATTIQNSRNDEIAATVRVRLTDHGDSALKSADATVVIPANGKTKTEQDIEIASPKLWSPETPTLYRAAVEVLIDGKRVDQAETTFGIRTIRFDAVTGFTLNGKPVKLKGGCLHHDNGPLGSAAIDRAEERRIEIMKANGFNAIRTSHNPPSPAFLDACDRLGMLVIDEAFDMWERPKKPQDYARFFKEWSDRDLAAMVLRDRNHPSVILWSIGNEINERADPSGVEIGRRLAEAVHRVDPTRPVTAAICHFWDHPGRPWSDTHKAFEVLDVGGYNYKWQQYEPDHQKSPQRIMAGTESYPREAFENWRAVLKNPYVIGDFVWTGMDYFGEAGIGHAVLDNEKQSFLRPWPWFNAYCGDIDVCGFKKPQSYFRDVVWGRSMLEMAVHAPIPQGRTEKISDWGWPDEQRSWTWPGQEGKPMQVTVYSSLETVRLELNGQTVGEKPVSADTKLTARFELPYAPGELRAVGLVRGQPAATLSFRSAGPPKGLRLSPDRRTLGDDRNDLSFVTVEVIDETGKLVPDAAVPVHFTVRGQGELAAVGSGHPSDAASFRAPVRTTFRGRCLAILRPIGQPGSITLEASAGGLAGDQAVISVRPIPD